MQRAGSGGTQRTLPVGQAAQRGAGKKKSGKKASSKAAAIGLEAQAGDPPVEYLVASGDGFGDSRTLLQGVACNLVTHAVDHKHICTLVLGLEAF